MPYISQRQREQLDYHIDSLATAIKLEAHYHDAAYAGLLNYAITRLALRLTPRRYWSMALTLGTLHAAAQEFYRRYVAPYENEKRAENGDAFDIAPTS